MLPLLPNKSKHFCPWTYQESTHNRTLYNLHYFLLYFSSHGLGHEESSALDGLEVELLVNEVCWIVSSATVINCFGGTAVSNEPSNTEMKMEKETFEQDLGNFVNALNDIMQFLDETIWTFPSFHHDLTVTADLVSLKFVLRLVTN